MNNKCEDFVLEEIVKDERICTFFQPIVSLKTGTIFAYEALVRGIRPYSDTLITPNELFSQAGAESVCVEFDRLCRKKALENFKEFQNKTTAFVFMNINTSVIGTGTQKKPYINTMTRQMGFDPQHIGLELLESKASSSKDLIDFVDHYRDSGFLIVVDDFGCEQSNLDRLIQIHPDIIKIDRSLISGVEKDTYRQSILKSIHSLAEMTGALCLAEGVETLNEIRTCHLLGIDLYQGFAIACPSPDLVFLEQQTKKRLAAIQSELHRATLESIRQRRRLTADINILANWLIRQLSSANFESMNQVFEEFIAINSEIECIYLLNSQGIQISDTIISPFMSQQKRPAIFSPAKKGTDHSFKSYYTCFEAFQIDRHLTDAYLSLASGNLCRTFSVRFKNSDDPGYILCMDFLEEAVR